MTRIGLFRAMISFDELSAIIELFDEIWGLSQDCAREIVLVALQLFKC